MGDQGRKISVLRLNLKLSESSPVVKEFSEYALGEFDTTICSLFEPENVTPTGIEYISGDNTILGFFTALKTALNSKNYEIIHTHYAHVGVLYAVYSVLGLRPRRSLRRAVYTVHTSFPNLKLRNRLLTAIVFLTHSRIVFCGNASANSFPRWFRRLGGNRTRIIPNGINTEEIRRVRNNTSLRSPSISSIVAVGRLIPSKNFETVIRAISDLDVTLTIIGDGELKETLSLIARECGVQDRVHFVGMIPRIEVYQYLMQSSTFVSASMVEGLPKAVLEAMACGCLPVLSDIPAHREISDNIDTPVPMVPPTDHRGFAAAIRTIVQMPAIQRQELSRIYMRLVEEKYSLSRMLAEYRAVYTELLENRSALRKLDMP